MLLFAYIAHSQEEGGLSPFLCSGLGTEGTQSSQLLAAAERTCTPLSFLLFPTHLLSFYSHVPQHVAICVCYYTANLYSKYFSFFFFFPFLGRIIGHGPLLFGIRICSTYHHFLFVFTSSCLKIGL